MALYMKTFDYILLYLSVLPLDQKPFSNLFQTLIEISIGIDYNVSRMAPILLLLNLEYYDCI